MMHTLSTQFKSTTLAVTVHTVLKSKGSLAASLLYKSVHAKAFDTLEKIIRRNLKHK